MLLRGEKGSAKTTLARGLAALMGDAPFVELPLGATEDRLVGSLDATAALAGEGVRFRPGLLAEAHGGVLYVDEINLLADHLVDTLLDVAVSGENVVERDGVSHRHPARFVLVGSMNPEEGELRPQLLDRFGLCVDVVAPRDVSARAEAVRRRLAFDAARGGGVDAGTSGDGGVDPAPSADAIGAARPASVDDDVLLAASGLAVAVGVEGLRGDLCLCRAAAALAGVHGRSTTSVEDLRQVAPLVLSHRRRRDPFDPAAADPSELEHALDQLLGEPPAPPSNDATGSAEADGGDDGDGADDGSASDDRDPSGDGLDGEPAKGSPGGERPLAVGAARRVPVPAPAVVGSSRGRFVRDAPVGPDGGAVSVAATVRAVAGRRVVGDHTPVTADDLRTEVRVAPPRRTVVLCVDLSGSMGADRRAEAATGLAIGLLTDAYQQRDRVALVGFRADGAEVLLSPTSSVEVARNRLEGLSTGGASPLAEGLTTALRVALAPMGEHRPLLVVLTDGRATGAPDARERSLRAAAEVRRRDVPSVVLDCESGGVRLGLARSLAEAMGATYAAADDLAPTSLANLCGFRTP